MSTVVHPRIRPGALEEREYQATIAAAAMRRPTLVVLPTGLGKTAIAVRVAAECLRLEPTRSILLMAPTRPLVVQHARTLAETLLAPPPTVWTGHVAPEKREFPGPPPHILVATPQVIAHDLENGRMNLEEFSLLVFDEAHRAVGDYPYVAIGAAAKRSGSVRVLAMTASPGSSLPRIRRVWANLGLAHFEYRTVLDPDVAPFLFGVGVETVEVGVPPALRELALRLRSAVVDQSAVLSRHGFLPAGETGRRAMLEAGERLHAEIAAARRDGTPLPPKVWTATTAQSVAMKELHALELIEGQGVESLRKFLDRQRAPGKSGRMTPAQRGFLADPNVIEVIARLRDIELEHPKVPTAVELVRTTLRAAPGARVLVFTQYRSTADVLLKALEPLASAGIRPARFVGQASREGDPGLSQKSQIEVLDRFRSGEVNVLLATSVAEEGLDIPSTDLVIFYEPVPDVVRTIQRRGRTGRSGIGRVVVLVTQGTREVGMDRSSKSRERRMHEMLEKIEAEAAAGGVGVAPLNLRQRSLSDFAGGDGA
jgi:Fanconi anemia group M protein